MILLKNLIFLFIKLLILIFVITFEKVIGLPIVFATLFLVFIIKEKDIYKYIYIILGSIFLALTYNFSISFSLVLLVILFLLVARGNSLISSDINRVFVSIYVFITMVAFKSEIDFSSSLIISLFLGSLIALLILMKTLFAKYGLTKKIGEKKGNFFR